MHVRVEFDDSGIFVVDAAVLVDYSFDIVNMMDFLAPIASTNVICSGST